MKRHNPMTQKPFKRGDKRIDGLVFREYTHQLKNTGYFKEVWVRPEKLEQKKIKDLKNKQSQRGKNPNRLPYGSAKEFRGNQRAIQAYKKLANTPPNKIDWNWDVPPDLLWLKKYLIM